MLFDDVDVIEADVVVNVDVDLESSIKAIKSSLEEQSVTLKQVKSDLLCTKLLTLPMFVFLVAMPVISAMAQM